MNPTAALMLSDRIEDERRRALGRRHLVAPEAAAPRSRSRQSMSLIDMFRAAGRGLTLAEG